MNTLDFSEIIKRFGLAAIEAHPLEACAIVYNDELHIVKNIHKEPGFNFRIASQKLLKAYKSKTGLQLTLHSHPNPYFLPSAEDLTLSGKQAITTTDGVKITHVHTWG